MHCKWFILPLLLPTTTVWFSLDRKLQRQAESEENENFLILPTLIPSLWPLRLRFRLRFRRSWKPVFNRTLVDTEGRSDILCGSRHQKSRLIAFTQEDDLLTDCRNISYCYQQCYLGGRSIQPKFPEILVQTQWIGSVQPEQFPSIWSIFLRWTTFPGRTSRTGLKRIKTLWLYS